MDLNILYFPDEMLDQFVRTRNLLIPLAHPCRGVVKILVNRWYDARFVHIRSIAHLCYFMANHRMPSIRVPNAGSRSIWDPMCPVCMWQESTGVYAHMIRWHPIKFYYIGSILDQNRMPWPKDWSKPIVFIWRLIPNHYPICAYP